MPRSGARGLCLALLIAAAIAAHTAPPAAAGVRAPTVIVLSLDGVRYDQLDRVELPALDRIAREGARADRLLPVFPSLTFPAHVSMATGTHPDRHGIVANRFRDPQRGVFDYDADASWIEAEPLWAAAERQGVRSAVYFWVGSETPWRGIAATHRVAPFDDAVGEREKVDRILGWLDLPVAQRPQLVMSWWHGADRAGHAHGPGSTEVARALRAQDAALARLLAGLDARAAWPHTTLVVVSDHGMLEAGPRVDLRPLLRDAGVSADVVQASAVAHVHLRDRADASMRERALRALAALPSAEAFPLAALPPALRHAHPRRVGDIVVLAAPEVRFGRARSTERLARLARRKSGAHGWDVARVPEMAGILLARGRGIPPGSRPGPQRSIDLAATVAAWLGIAPPSGSEGRPMRFPPAAGGRRIPDGERRPAANAQRDASGERPAAGRGR